MAIKKKSGAENGGVSNGQTANSAGKGKQKKAGNGDGFFWSMSLAPRIDDEMHWFQLLPASFFTAVVIMITRMHVYNRPMDQFYWSGGENPNQLADFFSWFKMVAILTCAVLALVYLLYRLCTQSLFIKRTFVYIPMAIYMLFVVISYAASDYKEFALLGYNDRFEGTLTLLAYMVLLFYVINTVNTERNIKWIVYPIAVTSGILGLLGLSQALDHDFFRTTIGKKLITPSWYWPNVDSLNFTFQNKEIYQTVYNINYVSFYLTLLIPLFGLLFIHSFNKGKEEPIWKKLLWGALFTLLIFNLIGSASSGGILGMAFVVLVGLIVLNKRLIQWWKPVAILVVLTLLMGGVTFQRFMPELTSAINGVLNKNAPAQTEEPAETAAAKPGSVKPTIDYIETGDDTFTMSLNGNPLIFKATVNAEGVIDGIVLQDADGKNIGMVPIKGDDNNYSLDDERFKDYATVSLAYDGTNYYVLVNTAEMQWPFAITADQGIMYRNQLGKLLKLEPVPHIGWENNSGFGSGRGYIWSRTLPMLKDNMFIGSGADTYCLEFPHFDYAGKYGSFFGSNINIVVDKPHDMFMGIMVGTGGISLLALLVLWGMYLVQSFRSFWKSKFETFTDYAGVGIFLGICGFLVAGLVNDSSVSVTPMFYGLLGTGIAINMMLNRQHSK